ncbi:conserved hypothetical protein [Trichinella spiralis]|uniref:hypothetical protein n=1 Tax=Trichinella spiralis TaxID=6334 RepID=UPI0001EFC4AD|nr:conserved hypothetical protein [Trichinella spiralis]
MDTCCTLRIYFGTTTQYFFCLRVCFSLYALPSKKRDNPPQRLLTTRNSELSDTLNIVHRNVIHSDSGTGPVQHHKCQPSPTDQKQRLGFIVVVVAFSNYFV